MFRYVRVAKGHAAIRKRLDELALERRRFGYRRLQVLLRREGIVVNIKRTRRIYREANLQVRRPKGYASALESAANLGSVRWGLESTGCYGNAFAKFLCEHDAEVYEVPGSYTKRHRRRSSRTRKSDALDAQAIAEAVLREADRLPRALQVPLNAKPCACATSSATGW